MALEKELLDLEQERRELMGAAARRPPAANQGLAKTTLDGLIMGASLSVQALGAAPAGMGEAPQTALSIAASIQQQREVGVKRAAAQAEAEAAAAAAEANVAEGGPADLPPGLEETSDEPDCLAKDLFEP